MPEVIPFSQIQDIPLVLNLLKVLTTGLLAFLLAFLLTPLWTNILYKYKIGIKIKETSVDGDKLTFVNKLHQVKAGTPTMGGLIVWFSVALLVFLSHFLFPYIAIWTDTNFIARLDFLKRSQVWLPLFVLVTAGILGLFDDYMSVRSIGSNKGGGMRFAIRFCWLFAIAFTGAWWFYDKLGLYIQITYKYGNFGVAGFLQAHNDGLDRSFAGEVFPRGYMHYSRVWFYTDQRQPYVCD
jgi:UDP-N-acetylmuramyl pentapeptide phosphotransferase/UDP-N-acetylglucosamine-1-phosphate transferase